MNNFEISTINNNQGVGALSAQTREMTEIQAAITIAKRFPRDEIAARVKCSQSCSRPNFAASATYSFPRGGKDVSGPSVDLARELARCWGNLNYGVRIVDADDDTVHIKAFAYDIESNNRIECEDKFSTLIQRRNKKTGVTEWVAADERERRELINRRGAIGERNAILHLLPPDLVDDALAECRITMKKAAAGELVKDKSGAVKALALAFESIGVNVEMLEKRLGHELKLISDDEIVGLRGIYKSLQDGHSKRSEYFEFGKTKNTEAADSLNQQLQIAPEQA